MIENGGEKQSSVEERGCGRTILVGVKLDAPSRELLTWALVKVAEPGDTVIALHILGNGTFMVFSKFLFHKSSDFLFMISIPIWVLCRDCGSSRKLFAYLLGENFRLCS